MFQECVRGGSGRLSSRRHYSGGGCLLGGVDSNGAIKPTGSLELGLTHNDSLPTIHKGRILIDSLMADM